ncbi:hypothetical protein [Sphingomonas profundi]|uniref:hypothetical protein n=1 Tax=Alterirhizorhabdus profundi TaxID=2681549 RepID=UPI001E4C9795|nr:hypothetical protein [Sphingomonas profundi]
MRRPVRILPPVLLAAMLCTLPAVAAARDPLGVFEGWGAFRDARPLRCFAIAEPARRGRRGDWRPFAAVSAWPTLRVRGQLHVRLSAAKRAGTPVYLTIGERRFLLASGKAEAWAPDAPGDAAIVAAMRGASSMSLEAIDLAGRPFADTYRLRGAASAIDAAALGCLRAG